MPTIPPLTSLPRAGSRHPSPRSSPGPFRGRPPGARAFPPGHNGGRPPPPPWAQVGPTDPHDSSQLAPRALEGPHLATTPRVAGPRGPPTGENWPLWGTGAVFLLMENISTL